jgi:hypothetical protein
MYTKLSNMLAVLLLLLLQTAPASTAQRGAASGRRSASTR